MKRLPVLAFFGALLALTPIRSEASAAVSFDFFYDELAPYGNWVDVDGYGYCFQPQVSAGWRPYYNGDWVYTDDGWCWNSSESWGWATYHYGRWANVRGCGWVWVPGYEWAPAWVSWRTGGDYIGWAPLPPECGWNGSRISFGVSFGFDIGPSYYNFCSPRYFGYGNVGRYCAPWRNNVNIIEQTTNITNITNVVNNNTTIINSGGPGYDFVRRNSDRPIRRAQIERVTNANGLRKGGQLKNDLRGDTLRVISPRIAKNKNARPKEIAARASSKNVDRGWSDIKDPNRAKQLRENMKNEAKVAANRSDNPKRANTRDGQGAKPGNAANQARDNARKNSREVAGNDRKKQSNGLKPFLAQDQTNSNRTPANRKQESAPKDRQQQIAKNQRPLGQAPNRQASDARRNADVDAARRQQQGGSQQLSKRDQVLRQQAKYETAGRQPSQVARPQQAQQHQSPSQRRQEQPPQRSPQVQRPQQQQQRQSSQRPQQAPPVQSQQRSRQAPPKKEEERRQGSPQMQRPQYQRPSQPQMQMQRQSQPQRPSNSGGRSSSGNERKRS